MLILDRNHTILSKMLKKDIGLASITSASSKVLLIFSPVKNAWLHKISYPSFMKF